ncbi:hypothetical protein ABZX85_16090 [Streptomyces sp. NPDC004539]|uniref:hypothetical protein n=1 Tax=Streptomyces sp. NPDC004539 TaxID=3154280 RepID=UPI0033A69776
MRPGRSRTARWAGGVCALLSVALASGCGTDRAANGDDGGGGGGGGDKPPTALVTALREVRGSDPARAWIEFGDVAALRGGSPAERNPLLGYGEPKLAPAATLLPDLTGIDPFAARTALSVGKPPDEVGFLYGSFDPAAIGAKLKKLGYAEHPLGGGESTWTVRDDRAIDPADPLAQIGIVTSMNVVRVSPRRIVYGGAGADVDRALKGTGALADDKAVGAVADCLGEVRAAWIGLDEKTAPEPMGIGVRQPAKGAATEVVCMTTASGDAAESIASAWPGRVRSTTSMVSNEPWSKLLSHPEAEVIGGSSHVVRLTARPTGAVNVLFDAWLHLDLGPLLTGARPAPEISAK